MPRVLLVVLLALLGATLVACRSTPSDSPKPPKLGACRMLSPGDVETATDDTEPVACTEPHTAETFLVGTLPASTGKAYTSRTHGAHVHKACTSAFATYIGADESLALRTRLSWAWFRPSESAWKDGARWFRCDVVGGPADAKEWAHLPPKAKGMLAKRRIDQWVTCARGEQFAGSTKVSCDQPHDWRAMTAIKIGLPPDPYPGDRVSEVRARDGCSDWVGAWTKYSTDYDYGYTVFHETEWKAGNRRALCWAKTDK